MRPRWEYIVCLSSNKLSVILFYNFTTNIIKIIHYSDSVRLIVLRSNFGITGQNEFVINEHGSRLRNIAWLALNETPPRTYSGELTNQ